MEIQPERFFGLLVHVVIGTLCCAIAEKSSLPLFSIDIHYTGNPW